MTSSYRRRTLLRTAGVAVAGALAGCGGGDSTTEETDEPADNESSPEPTPTQTSDGETQDGPSIDDYLSKTDNYDSVVDKTGSDAVTVQVGVEANGAYYGFGPAAIRIDSGTTVTWEWTGKGSTHNVAAEYGADFKSEQSAEKGHTYKQTFDESGTVLYRCIPHGGIGMKGAVVVE